RVEHGGRGRRVAQREEAIVEDAGGVDDAVDAPVATARGGDDAGHRLAIADVGRGDHDVGAEGAKLANGTDAAREVVVGGEATEVLVPPRLVGEPAARDEDQL